MPSRRVVRRCIGAGAVCVLGLATAVGVAWFLSLVQDLNGGMVGGSVTHAYSVQHFAEGRGPGEPPAQVRYVELSRFDRAGGVFFESTAAGSRTEGAAFNEVSFGADMRRPQELCSGWVRPVVLPWIDGYEPWPGADDNDFRFAEARGWPLPCVWCGFTMETDPAFRISAAAHGAIEIPSIRQSKGLWSGTYPAVLPWRPLWAGLLVDAVFYGAIWACSALTVMFIAAGGRAHRIRRGQCAKCGYPLAGVSAPKCPECGLERAVAVTLGRGT